MLACGIFGNVTEADIVNTIHGWPMLCREGSSVIWTRGASRPGLRQAVRDLTKAAGFEELAFDGAPAKHGVGLVRMKRDPIPLRAAHRFFEFVPDRVQQPHVSV